jgi:hypothetical protein
MRHLIHRKDGWSLLILIWEDWKKIFRADGAKLARSSATALASAASA